MIASRGALGCGATLLSLALLAGSRLHAQAIEPELWGVDNSVFALARVGDTLYVGGAFSRAGPSTGGAVSLSRHCTDSRRPFPSVAGYVYAIAGDSHGGWFLSGNFTAVGGVPRYCLAHVLADGSVASWNPNPNYVPYGTGGLLVAGNTVFVSGGFATIAGVSRQYIAALDATTGKALAWDAHANGLLAPLAIRGNTLYVGGYFSEIGGQPRNNIAALDAVTGDAMPWDPDADAGVGPIFLRDTTACVGGGFSHIGGQSRAGFAEVDLRTGLATPWNPSPGPGFADIHTMAAAGGKLYVGGEFDTLSGQPRRCLASFELSTGDLTSWDPRPSSARGVPEIDCVHAVNGSVYVCGFINAVGGKPRNFVAELDADTGLATDWNPDPLNNVWSISTDDSSVYLGGWFQSLGMVPRHNLAAFDLKTGRVTDWNPSPDGLVVYTLAESNRMLYVGGDFTQIGGQARSDLAALDPISGLATDWNPGADQVVRTLIVRGSTVYAGGAFSQIGGQPRRYLAALDARTGRAGDWNPDPNNWVSALATRGDTLFAGGYFRQMGGHFHGSLAAVDASSGTVLPWQVDTNGIVNALAVGANTVYAGGEFDQVLGGPSRVNLLAFGATSGMLRDWSPSPNGPREDAYYASIDALAARGDTVYVGGDFTMIAGGQRASLAALDGVSGALLDWAPDPDQSVHALDVSGDRLYAGGYFQAASWMPHLALLGVSLPGREPPPAPLGPAVVLSPIRPNPVRSDATIRYVLPSAASVSLALFDLQGRRVLSLLEHQLQPAGEHQLNMSAQHLPTGCYFYRLQAGGAIRTQKAVVLR
jgi:hypothetical protein